MRVLAVDDDVVTHMMLAMELQDIELIEAQGISDGFAAATNEDPDGVIIDLRLADGDGLDLVRKLRHQIGINQVPIVVLTAAHDPAQEAAVISAGADAYLPKPFDPHDVEAHLEAIMRLPAASRRGRRRQSVSLLREHRPVPPLVEAGSDTPVTPRPATKSSGDVIAKPAARRRWFRKPAQA